MINKVVFPEKSKCDRIIDTRDRLVSQELTKFVFNGIQVLSSYKSDGGWNTKGSIANAT